MSLILLDGRHRLSCCPAIKALWHEADGSSRGSSAFTSWLTQLSQAVLLYAELVELLAGASQIKILLLTGVRTWSEPNPALQRLFLQQGSLVNMGIGQCSFLQHLDISSCCLETLQASCCSDLRVSPLIKSQAASTSFYDDVAS